MAALPPVGSYSAAAPAVAQEEGPTAFTSSSSAPLAGQDLLQDSPHVADNAVEMNGARADEKMVDVPGADGSSDTLVVPLHTGLVYSSIMMLHAEPVLITREAHEGHPEAPERISRAFQVLKDNGCVKRMKRIQPREVERDEVALVHDLGVWEGVWRSQFYTRSALFEVTKLFGEQSSLYINEHTFRCARLSCGGVIELCDAVCSGKIRNGFAIVRPPGHHAEPDRSMGFCMFNNVAVAVRWIKEKYGGEEVPKEKRIKKILILDWDVHHGNGTQKAFEEDADVLFISLHRYENGEFYPGSTYGASASLGSGPGKGFSINIPWPTAGMGDGEYLYAFHHIVMPIAAEFGPDLVMISAGFDAAKNDPLGGCLVTPIGYAQMTYMLMGLANGKLIVALEGGYNVDALANSALAVTRTILGDPVPSHESLPSASAVAVNTMRLVKRDVSDYWKCIDSSPLDPVPTHEEGLPKVSISELLQAHRQYQIAKKFQLSELPVIGSLAEEWGAHALCSGDLMDRSPAHEAIVLFVHDMGSLRAGNERPNLALVPEAESAYLVDSSSLVLEWASKRGFAVVDVNLFTTAGQRGKATALEFLEFIWDNYIELSECPRIVLLSHAGGVSPVLSLLHSRRLDKDPRVRALCSTMGHETVPLLGRDEAELRKWYLRNARVFLPETHSWWGQEEEVRRKLKRAGKIVKVQERRAIQVLRACLLDVIDFVEGKLGLPAPGAGTDVLDSAAVGGVGAAGEVHGVNGGEGAIVS